MATAMTTLWGPLLRSMEEVLLRWRTPMVVLEVRTQEAAPVAGEGREAVQNEETETGELSGKRREAVLTCNRRQRGFSAPLAARFPIL